MAHSNRTTGKKPAKGSPTAKERKKIESQQLTKLEQEHVRDLGFMFTDELLNLPKPTKQQQVAAKKLLGDRFELFHHIRCGTPYERRFARDKLFKAYQNLAWGVVRKKPWSTLFNTNQFDHAIDIDDAVQAGKMGVLYALEKFDYTMGYQFSTYAWDWIYHYIQRQFENGGRIRLPVEAWTQIWRCKAVFRAEQQRLRREPEPEEIKLAMHLGDEEFNKLQDTLLIIQHCRPRISEDQEGAPHESVIAEMVDASTCNEPTVEELLDQDRLQRLLYRIIRSQEDGEDGLLSPIEGKTLWHLLGLGSVEQKNLPEAEAVLGKIKQTLHAAQKRALKKLHAPGSHQELLRPFW